MRINPIDPSIRANHKKHNRADGKTRKEIKEHFERVAALGCAIANQDCGGKLELHHPTGAGWGLRSDDEEVIPFCFNHHSAQTPLAFGHSVHKGTRTFEKNYGTQKELLEKTRRLLDIIV